MKKNTLKIVLAIALSGFSLLSTATPSYNFTDLGTLGGSSSWATAINNSGQVVGGSTLTNLDGAYHATLWGVGTVTDLGTFGSTYSIATAINDSGQIVGNSFNNTNDNSNRATLWSGGSISGLGNLGGTSSSAYGINNVGQVVGVSGTAPFNMQFGTVWNGAAANLGGLYITSSEARSVNNLGVAVGKSSSRNGDYHATLWNDGLVADLGTLRSACCFGYYSSANDINDSNKVVGWSLTPGQNGVKHAVLWDEYQISDLGTLGGNYSEASAINNNGLIVGTSTTLNSFGTPYIYLRSSDFRATLWDGTTTTDLNTFLDASTVAAGWVLSSANGINDSGWIVGTASNSLLGVSHAFMLAPVPEPDSYAMILMGVGLMSFIARRRKNQQI